MNTDGDVIAILDDGVSSRCFPFLRFQLEVQGGRVQPVHGDGRARGHGSLCAYVLQRFAPRAPLGSLCVVDAGSGRGKTADLLTALDWCMDHGVRLVNLSMGSFCEADRQALEDTAKRAEERGVLLVAANSNDGQKAWPACSGHAIGVEADRGLRSGEILPNPEKETGIDFLAGAAHRLKIESSPFVTPVYNSFAAPVVTAAAWHLLREKPQLSLKELKAALAEYRL